MDGRANGYEFAAHHGFEPGHRNFARTLLSALGIVPATMHDNTMQQPGGEDRRRVWMSASSCLIIFAAACVLRAAYLCMRLYWTGMFDQDVPNLTGTEASNIARSIVSGKGFSSPFGADTGATAWLTPVYPYLLAGVFRIFGIASAASVVVAAGLNELFSALTIFPIFRVGERIGNRRLGTTAAWMWAVHPLSISLAYEWLWYTSLSTLLIAWTLWATLTVVDSGKIRDWIGYGCLWGLGLLTNAAVMSLTPFAFAWLLLRKRSPSGRKLPAVALACMVMTCVPWVVRNYRVFHEFVPLRSNLGVELWMLHSQVTVDPAQDEALFRQLGEVGYGRVRGAEALQALKNDPRAAIERTWGQFLKTWTGNEHPLRHFLREAGWASRARAILFTGLSALALWGLLVMIRKRQEARWLIASHVLLFPMVYYIAGASFQYRLPIDPVVVLLAAGVLAQLGQTSNYRLCSCEILPA